MNKDTIERRKRINDEFLMLCAEIESQVEYRCGEYIYSDVKREIIKARNDLNKLLRDI